MVIYFHSLVFSVTSLISFQCHDLANFLNPYFKGNDLGLSSMTSTYLIFAGPFNALYDFYFFLILVLISTALLICTENTFWNINRDDKFVELFKKSFTLYVESGMRDMTERDIEILRNEQNYDLTQSHSEFYKFIVNHYLRKFHCLYLHLTSNHCLCLLNTAQPGESQARDGGESTSGESQGGGGQVLEQKFTWLRKLMLKFRRRQRA